LESELSVSKIPKIAHFYWGNERLSYLRYLTLYSFAKYNPNWTIYLYQPKMLQKKITWSTPEQKFTITGPDYYNKLDTLKIHRVTFDMEPLGLSNQLSEVIKSDFIRWSLLSTVGGVWSDMDILFFKPLNLSIIGNADTVVCQTHIPKTTFWSIGFLMSCPNNAFYSFLNEKAKQHPTPSAYQEVGTLFVRSLFKSVSQIMDAFPGLNVYDLPSSVVYPILDIPAIYDQNYAKSLFVADTIGLHWYGGFNLSGEYQNKITETTYGNYNNTLCHLIRNVVEQ